jgi:hypothetical protein
MGDTEDLIRRLREANPAVEERLPGPESLEGRRLLAYILSQPRRPKPRPSGRRRLLVVTALALAATAATYLWLRPVANPVLTCFATVDTEADRVALATPGELAPQACALLWAEGSLSNPEVAPGSVPPLGSCVGPEGGLWVFPTDDPDLCDRMGLAAPDPASLPEAEAIRLAINELVGYFATHRCQTIEQASADVRRILDQHRLDDWMVETTPETPDRPCASFSPDPDNRTIHLVPIPPPPAEA